MDKKRNYFIDDLRGVASVLVALFHFNEVRDDRSYYEILIKLGSLGVPMFFVVSGYCIFNAASSTKNMGDFLIKRFFRIYPVYWFSFLVIIGVGIFQKIISGTNSVAKFPNNVTDIFNSLTILYVPLTKTKVTNWTYWTLTYEIFYYFTFSFYFVFSGCKKDYWIVFVLLLSFLFLPFEDKSILFFFKYIGSFGLGIGIKMIEIDRKKKIAYLISFLSVGSLFVNSTHFFRTLSKYDLLFLPVSLLGGFFILYFSKLYNKPNFLTKLGQWSYSLYLIHVPIGCYIINSYFFHFVENNIYSRFLFDIANVSICLFLSYLIYKYIEIPFIGVGKKIVTNYIANVPKNC